MLVSVSKQLMRRVVSPLADMVGLHDGKVDALFAGENRLLVLMYHRIIEDSRSDPFSLGMCVTRRTFEHQIRHFVRHFSPIRLDEAIARVDQGAPLPNRAVALTFDDGYRDNLEVAAPILRAAGAPATLYVVAGDLESGEPFWWDRVIAAVAGTNAEMVDPATLGLTIPDGPLPLSGRKRRDSLARLLKGYWSIPPEKVGPAIERLYSVLRPSVPRELLAPRMRKSDVQTIAKGGFEIGAHTLRHMNPHLMTSTEVDYELRRSKGILETICQAPVTGFAYPDGRMSSVMPDLVRDAGFSYAVSTERGVNSVPYRRYALGRVGMPQSGIPDFKRAIRNVPILSATCQK